MVRPYRVKGVKKRKREEAETVDEGDKEEVLQGSVRDEDDQLAGIPIERLNQGERPGVVFVLQRASLELGKVGKASFLMSFEFMSCSLGYF